MSQDQGHAQDRIAVGATVPMPVDSGHGFTRWMVERWDADQTDWVARRSGLLTPQGADFHAAGVAPYEVSEVVGNLITNSGWTRLMSLLTNQSATQALDATHTRIGVGDGSTAETYADADLAAVAGSTHRWFQPVSGAGSLGTRTLAFAATFASADGNFAWNEFCLDATSGAAAAGNTVGALLFNRKASIAQGTKASGQTWTATATITFT